MTGRRRRSVRQASSARRSASPKSKKGVSNQSDSTDGLEVVKRKERWVVYDPANRDFGKEYQDTALIESGTRRGSYCLVSPPSGGVVLLRQTNRDPEEFGKDFLKQATARVAALREHIHEGSEHFSDRRTREWRDQFSHYDFADLRPEFVRRRVAYGVILFALYAYAVHSRYKDGPPAVITPLLATVLYPLAMYLVSALTMHSPPERYVFELLLAFDLYQLITSAFVFCAVLHEAYALGMLSSPWGNVSTVSSVWLRAVIWFHYHNRLVELVDTVLRIAYRKLGAYGAMHFYLRMVYVWSWFAACRVGGGDVYFITAVDSAVIAIRFLVFTLSLLRWSWNITVDFGMHAPKRKLFRKEYVYRVHVWEFVVLALHAVVATYLGNMPRHLMIVQLVVMAQSLLIYTNFSYTREAQDICRYQDARLMFSFDSSAWFFLYHFGVAMWLEGIDSQALSSWVIDNAFPVAARNPFRLLPTCEVALDTFVPPDAHIRCSDVLRVLLTKVTRRPPFVMGEVVSQFYSWNHLFAVLRASCHIPFVCILPYPIPGFGWYYDGLLWASLFVPWRTFSESDNLIRVSAFGMPWADITCSIGVPFWWALFPPSMEGLYGMVALGYKDAQEYYITSTQPQADKLRALAKKTPKPSRLDQEAELRIERLRRSAAAAWRVLALVLIACFLATYYAMFNTVA